MLERIYSMIQILCHIAFNKIIENRSTLHRKIYWRARFWDFKTEMKWSIILKQKCNKNKQKKTKLNYQPTVPLYIIPTFAVFVMGRPQLCTILCMSIIMTLWHEYRELLLNLMLLIYIKTVWRPFLVTKSET